MRNIIKEHIEMTEHEKKMIWRNGVFVFDTNVLLNLYRVSKDTRTELLEAIKEKSPNVWLPYQVAYEFMKDRAKVIFESASRYEDLRKEMDTFLRKCSVQLRKNEEDEGIREIRAKFSGWIDKEEHLLETRHPNEDVILEQILDIFDGRVGKNFSDEEIEEIKGEGEERYKRNVPPGYKDSNKENNGDDNNKYGDLLLWKQILAFSKAERKDIVFITNDQKEDWWNKEKGKTIGPRIELRKEFFEQTNQKFHMYTFDQFLEIQKTNMGHKVDENVLKELSLVKEFEKKQEEYVNSSQLKELTLDERIQLAKERKEENEKNSNDFEKECRDYVIFIRFSNEEAMTSEVQMKLHNLIEKRMNIFKMGQYNQTFSFYVQWVFREELLAIKREIQRFCYMENIELQGIHFRRM